MLDFVIASNPGRLIPALVAQFALRLRGALCQDLRNAVFVEKRCCIHPATHIHRLIVLAEAQGEQGKSARHAT